MSDEREKRISQHAYRLWEQEGQPADRSLDHWLEAERQIAAEAPDNQGEGSRSAARSYNQGTEEFVKSGQVERQAQAAEEALDGPEGESLRKAEKAGRRKSRGEDPAPRPSH